MKAKLSTLVLFGVLIGCASPMLTLRNLAAQTDQRGMRVQPASQGERRVALVIGNSAYRDAPLLNPANDARAMWRAVSRLPKINRDLVSDPSKFKGDTLPVEQVSWEDAIEFCARLSHATGRTYRLPTEAQWEYACRGGMTTTFYFGDTITPELVNYNGNYPYGSAAKGTYRETTAPAGSVGYPNAFGLYDMHGNVWEWCMDYWHESYNGAPVDGSSWESGGDASRRVLRGGSWLGNGDDCRSANRNGGTPAFRSSNFGFRIVGVGRALQCRDR